MKLFKQLFFVFTLLICFVSTGIAQTITTNIKGGLTFSGANFKVSSDNILIHENKVSPLSGFYFGGLATFHSKDPKLKFQVELYYNQNKSVFENVECQHTITFHQITLPVLEKIKIVDRLWLTAGAFVSANLKVKEFRSEDFKKFDFGMLTGLEYKLKNGLALDLRWQIGFNNMIINEISHSRKSKYNTETINLGIAYLLKQS